DARCSVIERRVIAHHPEFFGIDLDLPQIAGPDGVVGDRNLIAPAGAVVRDGQGFAGRGRSLGFSRGCGGRSGIHYASLETQRQKFNSITLHPKGAWRKWGHEGW